ncbi:MAG: KpsF/GutQ family sugar-phosphate isomerase [Bacteroidia bacterium]|nr:MAG: KpsF/GutQ family sugar-phosphate isomerase [Bacteroidia bacterium]
MLESKKSDPNFIFTIAKQVFNDEIAGIRRVLDNLDERFIEALQLIMQCQGKVIVSGMGKSGHVAGKIAATLASTGTPAFFVHPAEALHGDLGMIDERDVVVAISYSGRSDEIFSFVTILQRRHIKIISITGNSNSSLAKLADLTLDINVEQEACPLNLAPTTSTTATLVLGDALAVCLLKMRGFNEMDFANSHPGGSLGRRLLTTVNDLMHTGDKLPVVYEDSSFKDVILEISKKSLGFTGVINRDGRLLGLITDGDLRRVLDKYTNLLNLEAKDMMNANPKVIKENVLAVKSIDLMEQFKITGFLVVDVDNNLIGAFNLHDLFNAKLL